MSLLLEHIEDNIDALIDNPDELLYITKEDAEELGIEFDYSVEEVEEGVAGGLAGAAAGAAVGRAVGKNVANLTGLAAGYAAARKLPQYKAWKDAVAKVKALKKNQNHNPAQLAKLKAEARNKRVEFKRKRDQLISHKVIKHGAAGGAVGAAVGGAVGATGGAVSTGLL